MGTYYQCDTFSLTVKHRYFHQCSLERPGSIGLNAAMSITEVQGMASTHNTEANDVTSEEPTRQLNEVSIDKRGHKLNIKKNKE